jgi:hypothetical protein
MQQWTKALRDAPLFFKAVLLFIAGSSAWGWYTSYRKKQLQNDAENWPSITGRVVAREIKEKENKHAGTAFFAVVDYTYFLNQMESGRFTREFDSYDEAGDWLDQLYEKDVLVRYNPARRSQSLLLERELPPPIATSISKLHSLDLPIDDSIARRNRFLSIACLIGLAACAILHFSALFGRGVGEAHAFAVTMIMQLYAIGFSVAASMSNRETYGNIASKKYREAMNEATPNDIRFIGKLIWIYGTGWFAWTWMRGFFFHDESGVTGALIMFTAFQAIFLFEAYRMTQFQRWKRESRLR